MTPAATGVAAKVILWAKAQVGYHEGRDPDGNWNNREKYAAMVPGLTWVSEDESPWCCTWTSAAYLVGGGLKPNVDFPATASCAAAMSWYEKEGRFSPYPGLGAQILFSVPGEGYGAHHTGVVTTYDANSVMTTEGNSNTNGSAEGDGVYDHTNPRRIPRILGYGYPKFPEGVVSADPAWAGRK